ncbi:putative Ig domain-containing protein [uncultured Corynebacterium sp.]|uniref:putative Ig domain-containing protein n=1 Tax=uncultured Corynebacterium sp. TaxID=159447 RepID=UPI00288C60AD|nr:putative Ig domain-containing protein [uncultured Corynebacterium sp.]
MRSFRPGKTLIALFTAFAMSTTVFSPPDATAQTTSQWVPDQHEELFEQRDKLSYSKGGHEYICQVAHIADGRVYTDALCGEGHSLYYRDSEGSIHYFEDRQTDFSHNKDLFLNRFASYAIPDSLLPQVGESAEPVLGSYLSAGDTVTVHGPREDYDATIENTTDGFLAITLPSHAYLTHGAPVSVGGRYLGMYEGVFDNDDHRQGLVLLADPEVPPTSEPNKVALLLERESMLSYAPGEVSTINQGDKIFNNGHGCTVGYIDKPNNRIFLAGHCSDGGPLYFTDTQNRNYYLGTVVTEFDFEGDLTDSTMSKDWGYIDIPEHRSALLGENAYTSDSVLLPSMLRVGQMVYGFGQTTGHVMQNYVMGVINNVIHFTQDDPMHKGDSGGPNWVIDEDGKRHFIGVNSGNDRVGTGQAHKYGIAVGWEETPTSDEYVNYSGLAKAQWDAYQKAQDEAENPVAVNQGDAVGLDDNDRDLFLDQECTAKYVDHVHQRIYTSPACTGPGGARGVSTTYGWPKHWALAEIGTFFDAHLPYIQAPDDTRLGENAETPGALLSTDQVHLGDTASIDWRSLTVAGTIGDAILLLPYGDFVPEINTPVTIGDDVAGLVSGIYYDDNGNVKGIEVQSLVDANPVELPEGWQEDLLYEYAKATDETAPVIGDVEKKEFDSDAEIEPFEFTITDEYNELTVEVTDLPEGLYADIQYDEPRLRATVTVRGTPTKPGWQYANVTARDALGNETSRNLEFWIADATAPVIDTTPLILEAGEYADLEIPVTDNSGYSPNVTVSALPDDLTSHEEHIHGQTNAVGTHDIHVTATDPAGNSATATIPLEVRDTKKPTVNVRSNARWEANSEFNDSISIEVDDATPVDVRVEGLPRGLFYDESNRAIDGVTDAVGTHSVTVIATDAGGNTSEAGLELIVEDTTSPTVQNAEFSSEVGSPFSYVVNATDSVGLKRVTVSGLPHGLRFDENSRTISGTPSSLGYFQAFVTASDRAGNTGDGVIEFRVVDTVLPRILVDHNPPAATKFDLPIRVEDATKTALSVTGLPAGLRHKGNRIVGSTKDSGTHRVVITATDEAGNQASETITLSVPKPRPAKTTAPAAPSTQTKVPARPSKTTVPSTSATSAPQKPKGTTPAAESPRQTSAPAKPSDEATTPTAPSETTPAASTQSEPPTEEGGSASGSSKGGIAALVILGIIALVGGVVATNPQLMKQIQSMLP